MQEYMLSIRFSLHYLWKVILLDCVIIGKQSLGALEKEMATHSSVLAWRIQGTGRTELDMTEVT